MPPKGAAARRGQQGDRVAVGSTRPAKNKVAAAKKKSASGSGEVAPAPTRASPVRVAKSVASDKIAAQLSPVARVPVAVSHIVPRTAEVSTEDLSVRKLNLPPLWNAWYSTCCQVLHFVGDGGGLVGKCKLCGDHSPERKDVMLDPEQLAELRSTPCLTYDPMMGRVLFPGSVSGVLAEPSYPDIVGAEQVGVARLGGILDKDDDSVSSNSSCRVIGTKTTGMYEMSPDDSPLFPRHDDEFSTATPTDNEVSKYSFFDRLKHYMEGNLITEGTRASVELCILVEAGAAVRGMDPMKKEKKECIFFRKYMAFLDEIEDSMFSNPNLRDNMRVRYKNAKKENTGTSLWRKYETELRELRNFAKKIPGVGGLSSLPSGSNQLRHMKMPLVEALWREKHPVM